jgi:hypothetical protein
MKTEISEHLKSLDQSDMLCNLPDTEFDCGTAIHGAIRAAGYDESPRNVINNLGAWGMTVAEFAAHISTITTPPKENIRAALEIINTAKLTAEAILAGNKVPNCFAGVFPGEPEKIDVTIDDLRRYLADAAKLIA